MKTLEEALNPSRFTRARKVLKRVWPLWRYASEYHKLSTGWVRKSPKVRGKAAVKALKRERTRRLTHV